MSTVPGRGKVNFLVVEPLSFFYIFRFIYPPNIEKVDSEGQVLWNIVPPRTSVCRDSYASAEEIERNYTFFVNNHQFAEAKKLANELAKHKRISTEQQHIVYVGFRQLNENEVDKYSYPESPPPTPYPYRDQINATATVWAFQSSCNYLESGQSAWATNGCKVGISL